jgi:phosphoserine phosphatase RsbU/P
LDFGTQFGSSLEETEINLKENDLIVLYTDGITESKNLELEDFGEEKFEEVLLNHSGKNVDEISNEVIKEITLFSKQGTQHDDITLVILKWKHNFKKVGEKEWLNSAPQSKTRVV